MRSSSALHALSSPSNANHRTACRSVVAIHVTPPPSAPRQAASRRLGADAADGHPRGLVASAIPFPRQPTRQFGVGLERDPDRAGFRRKEHWPGGNGVRIPPRGRHHPNWFKARQWSMPATSSSSTSVPGFPATPACVAKAASTRSISQGQAWRVFRGSRQRHPQQMRRLRDRAVPRDRAVHGEGDQCITDRRAVCRGDALYRGSCPATRGGGTA